MADTPCRFPLVRSKPVCLNAHIFPSLQFPCGCKEHSGGCHQSPAFPSGHSSFKEAKHVGKFSVPERLFPVGVSFQGVPSWKVGRSRTPTFSFGCSSLLWIVFHSTPISSRALTFCCPLYAISTVSFFLPLEVPLAAPAQEAFFFYKYFTRREKLLKHFLIQVSDRHCSSLEWSRDFL